MKLYFLLLFLVVASVAVSAGTINYEGSSTIGKFIADADKVYPGSTFKINDDTESLGGEQATSDNPNYPISRQLYLVTHGEPNTEVKRFLDWTRSDEGQSVVRKRFVGLN
ncbi:MAG: hypothetical protein KZQ99_02105 [Candidatus Thiodiazotropha sp. (ex Dulcina madagascariensis)]|nr:hypothetical protein [Candidatus Thiodiazotropha sp. (ex Dulcina madagascariensis)]